MRRKHYNLEKESAFRYNFFAASKKLVTNSLRVMHMKKSKITWVQHPFIVQLLVTKLKNSNCDEI